MCSQLLTVLEWRISTIELDSDASRIQSNGYGSEAVGWIMDWVFKWGGYHSLTLGASIYNERAVRAYKKAGFKVEGINREASKYLPMSLVSCLFLPCY
jgi:RimJ/RimL family protein N-acetyltransferase